MARGNRNSSSESDYGRKQNSHRSVCSVFDREYEGGKNMLGALVVYVVKRMQNWFYDANEEMSCKSRFIAPSAGDSSRVNYPSA